MHSICDRLHAPDQVKEYYSLTLVQAKVIKLVSKLTKESPEGISLKTLSEILNISAASTSEQINTLVNRGWLMRNRNPEDRRSVLIKLSTKTNNTINKIHEFFDAMTTEILKDFDSKSINQVTDFLNKFF